MRSPVLASIFLLLSIGCGWPATYEAQGTSVTPAALARIQVGRTEGAQTIDVTVFHLAPPARVGTGYSEYAVWIIPENGRPIHAGNLDYNAGTRAGRLRATTPHERVTLLVTAEHATAGAPLGPVVMRRELP